MKQKHCSWGSLFSSLGKKIQIGKNWPGKLIKYQVLGRGRIFNFSSKASPLVEGVARCMPEQCEARLKETLAKSARLTQRLMKRLDQESDESGDMEKSVKTEVMKLR